MGCYIDKNKYFDMQTDTFTDGLSEVDYPLFKSTCSVNLDTYFKEQIVYLFFNKFICHFYKN